MSDPTAPTLRRERNEEDALSWRTCVRCGGDLYPHLCRPTKVGLIHSACRWTHPGYAQLHADRLEDLRFMDAAGECATGAANRLGMTFKALEKWLTRHDHALWRRLRERDERAFRGEYRGQKSA